MIVFLAVGCQPVPPSPRSAPVSDASDGLAGVVAHTQSAQRHVTRAMPHADSTGKVYLSSASDEHDEVLNDAAGVKVALLAAQEQIRSLDVAIRSSQADHAMLQQRWYVVWGRRIERALWILGIGWLVLGAASVLLGLGNPLSWSWRAGKEITRLVPAMNAFSWIRDWIVARRNPSPEA